MKKLLYGSTALVAAGLLCGAAAAEEGVSVSVSGWWFGSFQFTDQDDGVGEGAANRRDHAFNRFGTINVGGNTTLDNGLQVGVSFDWNTETGPTEITRDGYAWMEFGGFRFEAGRRQGAAYLMQYSAPAPSNFGWGFNDQLFRTASNPGGNQATFAFLQAAVSMGSEKVTAFTPRFGGFQLGISYTPEQGSSPGGVTIFTGPDLDNTRGEQSEIIDIGANFVQSFDELDLNIAVGWSEGDLEANNAAATLEDATEWTVGASLSWMSWTFGAAYRGNDLGTDPSNSDRTDWNVGVRYVTGPWGVGVQYQVTEVQLGASGLALATTTGEDKAERFAIGGSYEVGPGISFHAGIQNVEFDAARTTAAATNLNENDSTAIYLGTSIFF
jgi:outer membrane protein OmpU